MNIIENIFIIEAKTNKSKNSRKISYYISESPYSICLDKKENMLAQIQAYEILLGNTMDENDFAIITKEILELKEFLGSKINDEKMFSNK